MNTKTKTPGAANQVAHTVHIMATVRVTARNIEASSHEEACEKACDSTDLTFLSGFSFNGTEYDYAAEITACHVDEVDDEDYNNSTWHGMQNEELSDTAVLRWVDLSREELLEAAYIELWAATENGFTTEEFFKLRETFRNVVQES